MTDNILKILDFFKWFFRWLGVDYEKFRALLWVKLTVDNRTGKIHRPETRQKRDVQLHAACHNHLCAYGDFSRGHASGHPVRFYLHGLCFFHGYGHDSCGPDLRFYLRPARYDGQCHPDAASYRQPHNGHSQDHTHRYLYPDDNPCSDHGIYNYRHNQIRPSIHTHFYCRLVFCRPLCRFFGPMFFTCFL